MNPQNKTYYVKGMHCTSCELIIEKQFLKLPGVTVADASTALGTVTVTHTGEAPKPEALTASFRNEGYVFSNHPVTKAKPALNWKTIALTVGVLWLFFKLANTFSLGERVAVTDTAGLGAFFLLGIVAGLSSCAALVGGLVLSMSKQWNMLYGTKGRPSFEPHFLFNSGRLASYAIGGGLLGALGSKLQFSLSLGSAVSLAIAALMAAVALQMLGVPGFRRLSFSLPKRFTRAIANEQGFRGKLMPFVLGAATFLLPCGFTLTAQGIALISGSFWRGAAILFFFALGTAPILLGIGLMSAKITASERFAPAFSTAAGVILLFFAAYTLNSQLNVLGAPSLSDTRLVQKQTDSSLAPLVNGKQLLSMRATAIQYSPNRFTVKAGVPVRWEIYDAGTSGCTGVLVSRDIFPREKIVLRPGQTAVKEFTLPAPGTYKFSCSMGMVTGAITAI